MRSKNPIVALLLGLLAPGLGQFYLNQTRRAIFFFSLVVGFMIFARSLATTFLLLVLIIVSLTVVRLYSAIEASSRAGKVDKKAGGKPVYIFIILGLVFQGLAALSWLVVDDISKVMFAQLPNGSMEPQIHINERFAYVRTREIERLDVLVFEWPPDPNIRYVQRCVALPGDSLTIEDGHVKINGEPVDKALTLQQSYELITKDGPVSPAQFERMGVFDFFQNHRSGGYIVQLTEAKAKEIASLPFVASLEPMEYTLNHPDNFYPSNKAGPWNASKYGPLYIPKKGESIKVNSETLGMYGQYILQESPELEISFNKLRRDGTPLETYTFKSNYYFTMGDNRHNAHDSRFWGLVPQNRLIGKTAYVIFSDETSRIGTSL